VERQAIRHPQLIGTNYSSGNCETRLAIRSFWSFGEDIVDHPTTKPSLHIGVDR
jgi:hypothetical protein